MRSDFLMQVFVDNHVSSPLIEAVNGNFWIQQGNLPTPYWTLRSGNVNRVIFIASEHKDIHLDHIVLGDTGGIGPGIDIQTGFNRFFEIHQPVMGGSGRKKILNSVCKRLVFRSQEFDPEVTKILTFKSRLTQSKKKSKKKTPFSPLVKTNAYRTTPPYHSPIATQTTSNKFLPPPNPKSQKKQST